MREERFNQVVLRLERRDRLNQVVTELAVTQVMREALGLRPGQRFPVLDPADVMALQVVVTLVMVGGLR